MRTAVFTGAGVSKALGYPLTGELFKILRKNLRKGELFEDLNTRAQEKKDRARLTSYLRSLFPGYATQKDDELPLITDVFSLVEYALVSGDALLTGGEEELRDFRDLLKQAIGDILVGAWWGERDACNPVEVYEEETSKLLHRWLLHYHGDLGIVTTNYDIELESRLYRMIPRIADVIDLGYDWRHWRTNREVTRPPDPGLRVYKLHGSLDVLRCRRCGYVYFNPLGSIWHQPYRKKTDDDNTCICNPKLRLDVHIVAPSLVRDIHDANLLSVWRSASEYLRLADRWYIIGYSLPPEDLAIKSLLLRAYQRARKPEVIVVQYDNKEEARYRFLFPECTYITGGLGAYLRAAGL